MNARPLYLVVTRGPSAGARLRLDETPRIVGRARDADLVIHDMQVSRRHVSVQRGTADATGLPEARITTCDGAKGPLVAGVRKDVVALPPGESFVLGETAFLVVVQDETLRPTAGDSVRTDVRTLMTGIAADVRGLATVLELVDSLDLATDASQVISALREWGEDHLVAREVTLEGCDPEGDPALKGQTGPLRPLVERPGVAPATMLLSAPLDGPGGAWLTFEFGAGPPGITDTVRRLATVAARLASATLARIASLRQVEEECEAFRRASVGSARSFLGASAAAGEIARLVPKLAASDAVVLIEGETGVGKTFLARILHEAGPRAKEPLRVINCAALPDTLVESELFGHERGAFTGANSGRAGALESAGRGTLLLDEIGDLPLPSQAKLLRVLEEKRFERLGSNRPLQVEARILVATNRDLAEMVQAGTFRKDLFYRVAVVKLRVPPLRERGDDLVLLAHRILADLSASAGRRVTGFSPGAIEVIRRYPWPGNVRELRNAVERALVMGESSLIEPQDLPEALHGRPAPQPADTSLIQLPATLASIEERAIQAAMKATSGNQTSAAALLGISRNTLYRKLKGADAAGDEG